VLRLGVGLLQRSPPDLLVEVVQLAEALGYDTLWYGNEKFYRDPWIGLAVAAQHSRRLRLGTFVQDPYTLHPALTAVAIATLDELSGGRAVLGLGAGGGGGGALAYQRRRPVVALREAIQVIRPFLAGERVHLDGEMIRFLGGRLHFPPRPGIPVYVASRGNLVLRMAGEVADGVMIATYATPPGVTHALAQIDQGLGRAGRSRAAVRLISRVDTWIDADRARARNAVRKSLAGFLTTSYPDMGFVHAVGLTLSAELQAVLARKDREHSHANAHLVPDEVVDAFTWTGSVDEVAGQIAAVARLGIHDVTVLFHPPEGADEQVGMRLLAQEVKPLVEEMTRKEWKR
jgi:5,10-methylenetetrahydromethanopterin reductase